MPFDNSPVTYPELRAFRDKLRDRGQWPEGFEWDFGKCRGCALGLMGAVSTDKPWVTGWEPFHKASEMLDVPVAWADWLFSAAAVDRRRIPAGRVTPEMVADDIDHLLANGL